MTKPRRHFCRALALATALLLPAPARPQAEPPGAAATALVAARLDDVTGMPLYLRLYRAHLPAAAHVAYEGASMLIYDLSGPATLEFEGGPTQPLAAGAGAFFAPGQGVTIRASPSGPAELLLFLLTARPNQRRPLFDRPATIRELFRTPEPLPGLQDGPYDFSLERVTLPAATAAAPAYARSGAALDYVLAGEAAMTAEGKTESIAAEAPLFERFGWFHQLGNAGSAPLVLLQANLSQEGVPAVHLGAGK